MALVFILAVLLDSTCSAACIAVDLKAPVEHCTSPHGGHRRSPAGGCELHGHLKPVVKDRGFVAPATSFDALASFENPVASVSLELLDTRAVGGVVLPIPPLLQHGSVLRI